MLTDDRRDALQEIANIGMGQAGSSIAQVLGEFVQLSIPRILIVPPAQVPVTLAKTVDENIVSAVRQAFFGGMRGEALVIFGQRKCNDLADLMGYESDPDHAEEIELLLDLSNILVGACLGGIAEQLQLAIGFSAPSLMADALPLARLLQDNPVPWTAALLVEVDFSLEKRSFACNLVILMPEDEIKALMLAVDRFLEAL